MVPIITVITITITITISSSICGNHLDDTSTRVQSSKQAEDRCHLSGKPVVRKIQRCGEFIPLATTHPRSPGSCAQQTPQA